MPDLSSAGVSSLLDGPPYVSRPTLRSSPISSPLPPAGGCSVFLPVKGAVLYLCLRTLPPADADLDVPASRKITSPAVRCASSPLRRRAEYLHPNGWSTPLPPPRYRWSNRRPSSASTRTNPRPAQNSTPLWPRGAHPVTIVLPHNDHLWSPAHRRSISSAAPAGLPDAWRLLAAPPESTQPITSSSTPRCCSSADLVRLGPLPPSLSRSLYPHSPCLHYRLPRHVLPSLSLLDLYYFPHFPDPPALLTFLRPSSRWVRGLGRRSLGFSASLLLNPVPVCIGGWMIVAFKYRRSGWSPLHSGGSRRGGADPLLCPLAVTASSTGPFRDRLYFPSPVPQLRTVRTRHTLGWQCLPRRPPAWTSFRAATRIPPLMDDPSRSSSSSSKLPLGARRYL